MKIIKLIKRNITNSCNNQNILSEKISLLENKLLEKNNIIRNLQIDIKSNQTNINILKDSGCNIQNILSEKINLLENKLLEKDNIIRDLQLDIKSKQTDINVLKDKLSKIKSLNTMSIDEMESVFKNRYDVLQEEDGTYSVPTQICKLGGCYMNKIRVDNRILAYRIAFELSIINEKMELGVCPECYSDYMNECM